VIKFTIPVVTDRATLKVPAKQNAQMIRASKPCSRFVHDRTKRTTDPAESHQLYMYYVELVSVMVGLEMSATNEGMA